MFKLPDLLGHQFDTQTRFVSIKSAIYHDNLHLYREDFKIYSNESVVLILIQFLAILQNNAVIIFGGIFNIPKACGTNFE